MSSCSTRVVFVTYIEGRQSATASFLRLSEWKGRLCLAPALFLRSVNRNPYAWEA
jgi:hypothetical protein